MHCPLRMKFCTLVLRPLVWAHVMAAASSYAQAGDTVPEIASLKSSAQKHWAFIVPTRPSAPNVKNKQWVRNEIDAFVLARLEKEKIKPSPEADPRTLIR